MQQETTVSQSLSSTMRRLLAGGRHWGSVGMLMVMLLPVSVAAVGPGDLDTSFGSMGRVLTNFPTGSRDTANAMARQPDGKIIVAGSTCDFDVSDTCNFAVARYHSKGALDTSFGNDGLVTTGFSDHARTLAIQPRDGRLVVAGSSNASGSGDFALARYHAITCSGAVVTQSGTAGHDTIVGTDGPDVIFGFGGTTSSGALAVTTSSVAGAATISYGVGAATIACRGARARIPVTGVGAVGIRPLRVRR